jgi:hypothetical protein
LIDGKILFENSQPGMLRLIHERCPFSLYFVRSQHTFFLVAK